MDSFVLVPNINTEMYIPLSFITLDIIITYSVYNSQKNVRNIVCLMIMTRKYLLHNIITYTATMSHIFNETQ